MYSVFYTRSAAKLHTDLQLK